MRWRKTARLGIAVFAVLFAVWVAFAFKKRDVPTATPPQLAQTDPSAVVESTAGTLVRYKGTKADVTVAYERQLTYSDGATKLIGVKVSTQPKAGGRTFVITGKEGKVGENQSTISLEGDVRLAASDGLTVTTEHATYVDAEGIVRAPGPANFAQGRLSGSGVSLTYDKNRDVLTIADQAIVNQTADAKGKGAMSVSAGSATIARKDRFIQFERGMHVARGARTIEADNGVARLTEDGNHIEGVDLHGGAHVGGGGGKGKGGLEAIVARDMTLRYTPGGDALEHATAIGDAVIQLAGERGQAGRKITANALDISLAPDGSTPTALAARESVQTVFPGESGGTMRTIRSQTLDAAGDGAGGLTRAQFGGDVQYRERGGNVDRAARSDALALAVKPGMSSIDEARFAHNVRFEEGSMAATAASVRYVPGTGILELSGSEPAAPVPRVVTEQIVVDAKQMDVTLAGPKVKASGDVKSVVQPPKRNQKTDPKKGARLPSMLKQDQPVNVTAAGLEYDSAASHAVYSGSAQLWQGDTSVKGATITIDDKSGDLTASGQVATTALFEQENKDKKKERVRSIATGKDFTYDEAAHRATYTGDVHMSGPQGDVTAGRVELFLKPSGNELDRAEAYDSVTVREADRKTTGARMTYFAAEELYVVTGTPVKMVDSCGRETTGRTLKFNKAADTIVVDGNERNRTQTKGGTGCK